MAGDTTLEIPDESLEAAGIPVDDVLMYNLPPQSSELEAATTDLPACVLRLVRSAFVETRPHIEAPFVEAATLSVALDKPCKHANNLVVIHKSKHRGAKWQTLSGEEVRLSNAGRRASISRPSVAISACP